MTTATDWDVRDADTGSQAVVTDVDVTRLPDDAPVMPMEDVHALAQRNAELTDLVDRLTDDKAAAYADVERLSAELDTLREQVGPLDQRWTPPTEQPTAWIEEQTIAHRAAEHRPSADTHTYIADLHRQDRQRWDSVHDDIKALTAHEPADVWDDELRKLTEPVPVDYSYRQTEAALWAQTMARFAKLDEDEQEGPQEHEPGESPPALPVSAEGEAWLAQGPAADEAMPGQPSVLDAFNRRHGISSNQDQQSEKVSRTTDQRSVSAEPPEPWWRRHADVIAGVAIGAGLFAALGVAYMTGVLT